MNIEPLADYRVQEGAARRAPYVMVGIVAEREYVIGACTNPKLLAFDTCEWFKRRARGSAALGTMTVEGVAELIRHLVANGATQTLAFQQLWHDPDAWLRRLTSAISGDARSARRVLNRT